VRNVALAARLAVRPEAVASTTARPFVVADPQAYLVRDLERAILKAAGTMPDNGEGQRPVKAPRSLPLPIALLLARGAEKLGRFRAGGRPSISRAQVRRIVADNVYRPDTLEQMPGWQAATLATLDEGMVEAMAWYRRRERV